MSDDPSCPMCGAGVEWSIWGSGAGAEGGAACYFSGRAFLTADLDAQLQAGRRCEWSGVVRRDARGRAAIVRTITPAGWKPYPLGIRVGRAVWTGRDWDGLVVLGCYRSLLFAGRTDDCEAMGATGPCWGQTEIEEVREGRRAKLEYRCRGHRGLIYWPREIAG